MRQGMLEKEKIERWLRTDGDGLDEDNTNNNNMRTLDKCSWMMNHEGKVKTLMEPREWKGVYFVSLRVGGCHRR